RSRRGPAYKTRAGVIQPARTVRRRGLQHVAGAVSRSGDGLPAHVPAKLEPSVGEDRRIDDGDASAVGGGAGRGRDRLPHPQTLRIVRTREAFYEPRLRLD